MYTVTITVQVQQTYHNKSVDREVRWEEDERRDKIAVWRDAVRWAVAFQFIRNSSAA